MHRLRQCTIPWPESSHPHVTRPFFLAETWVESNIQTHIRAKFNLRLGTFVQRLAKDVLKVKPFLEVWDIQWCFTLANWFSTVTGQAAFRAEGLACGPSAFFSQTVRRNR